jgi:hypothetical protein
VKRRLLETMPPREHGSVSRPWRQDATTTPSTCLAGSEPKLDGLPRPARAAPRVDVRLRWLAAPTALERALASLSARRGWGPLPVAGRAGVGRGAWPHDGAQPGAPTLLEVAGVEPARAVRWALRHLLDAEVVGPEWLCEWIADELLRRALAYCPRPGSGGPP